MSTLRRRIMGAIKPEEDYSMYAVHKKVNPEVMAICYAQGWAANENYMTFEEAAAVTDIGTAFRVNTITSFDEFQYFTSVTAIPNNAFNVTYSKLESIKLPPNIASIGMQAFVNCTSLLSVDLGNAQIPILNNTFSGCSNLAGSIDLSNVRALNGTPFRYSKLVLIDCGSQISALGQIVQDCNYVTILIVRRTTPPTLHTISATRLSSNNALVYVPDESVEAYKSASVWSTIADIIRPLSSQNINLGGGGKHLAINLLRFSAERRAA